MNPQKNSALVVVDLQIDFEPKGALSVLGGDEIVEPISKWMTEFETIVLTQDFHPKGHISFASSYEGKKPFEILTLDEVKSGKVKSPFSKEIIENYLLKVPKHSQVLWPDHCVQGTKGAEIDARLPKGRASLILRKGTNRLCDSYSAFFENDGSPTGLGGFLKERGVRDIHLTGLAGDYCVYWSALDAKKLGFEVFYYQNLTRFVNFPEGSRTAALKDLKEKGILIL